MKKISRAAILAAVLIFASCAQEPPAPVMITITEADTEMTDTDSTAAEIVEAESEAETVLITEAEETTVLTLPQDTDTVTVTSAVTAAVTEAQTVLVNADIDSKPAERLTDGKKTSDNKTETAPVPEKSARIDSGIQFEVYSEAYAHDILPDGANPTDDIRLDTSSPGEYSVSIGYEKDGISSEATVTYEVSDTEPPVLLNGGWDITIKTGKEFDIYNWVGVGDYYDDKVKLTYTGTVDTENEGVYPISVTASDSSGNHTDWDVTVKVMDTLPESDWDEGDKLPFDEFTERYGEEGTLGIDVSKWQGDIDFERVRDAGCKFVIMRIGKDTDGIVADEKFERNFAAAKAAGLKVGVYFYSCANTEEMIKADAAWIAETLEGQSLDLPVAFDWESFSNYQNYNMSIYKLNSLYRLFDDRMNAYGYDTMLYSSKNFLLNFWHTDKTVWLAHYTDRTNYTGRYELWQLSSTGRIDGIDGAVDLDIWYR